MSAAALRRFSNRPHLRWGAVAVVLLLAGTLAGFARHQALSAHAPQCFPRLKALAAEQVGRLQSFNRWLQRNHVGGYVGEVGWPGHDADAEGWDAVGQSWFKAADRDHLWVTAWSAAEGWPETYPMGIYRLSADSKHPSVAGSQAAIIERHAGGGLGLRGIDAPSGAFATTVGDAGNYSNLTPGTYNVDYYYPSAAEYRYLAGRGVRIVRLAFTWERVQQNPFSPLKESQLHKLRESIYDAGKAGLGVILDLHSFGAFWHADFAGKRPVRWALGSPNLPTTALADLWRRIATSMRNAPAVVGYDIMNEPNKLAHTPPEGVAIWQKASQQAAAAIRAAGDSHVLAVEAYGASGPEQFTHLQPRAWIRDPLTLTRYEMHQYFDSDGTGRYRYPLASDAAAATKAARAADRLAGIPTHFACLPG